MFIYTPFFLNFLGPRSSRIKDSNDFCGRCSEADVLIKSLVPPTHLLEMMEFSQKVRQNLRPRTLIASGIRDEDSSMSDCPIWYPKIQSIVEHQRVMCEASQIFLKHLAHRLNVTVKYRQTFTPIFYANNEQPIGIATQTFFRGIPATFYLRDRTENKSTYCHKS